MRYGLIALVLLGLVTAGCIGDGQHAVFSDGPGPPSPRTAVVVSGPVGIDMASRRDALARCPATVAAGSCRAVRSPHATPARWSPVVSRTLDCSPDEGDYADRPAACRALAVLIDGLRSPSNEMCSCPLYIGPGYAIEGRYELADIRLRFTACDMCGQPKDVRAAFGVLFSGL